MKQDGNAQVGTEVGRKFVGFLGQFVDEVKAGRMNRRTLLRRARDQAMRDAGLTKVRGGLGGTYWE